MWNRRPLAVGLMALLAAGCISGGKSRGDNGAVSGPAAPVEIVKGFAVHGDEVRAFRPCGEGEDAWVVDRTGVLWEVHQSLGLDGEPCEELFAVVEGRFVPPPEGGFGAEYKQSLEVTRIIYVAREGFRCDLDLSAFRYRIFGNEPFWNAYISDEGIVLKMPGYEDRSWTEIEERRFDGGVVFLAEGPPGPVRLNIVEQPRRDSMSGAYFACTAEMHLGEEVFHGWAMPGSGPTRNRRQ